MFKLFKYLKPYWIFALLAPLFMFLQVITDLLQPTLMAKIIDQGVAQHDLPFIIHTGLLMIGVALLGLLGGLVAIVTSSIASMSFGTDLRSQLYQKVQNFSFANLDKFKTASLITRLTNDITQVQTVVLMSLRLLVRAPLLCIGGLVMAISINTQLALILVIAIPVLVLSIGLVMKKGFPLFTAVQQRLDKVNAVMRENLTGVRVIKAFVRADYEQSRFQVANNDLVQISLTASRLLVLVMPLMMLVMNLSVVAVIWFGGLLVNNGSMTVGEVMAFINYLTQILFALLMVAFMLMMVARAKASADRINEVLATEIDVTDAEAASTAPIKTGSVTFENVSFHYQNAGGEPVLKNISFTAKPGETVAILGATGSGKSSLVNLIPRLYDVTSGRVLIDGRDVRSIKLETLRDAISVVLQDSILFSGSIKANIRWGNENASEAEIIAAAQAAQADEFIRSFPEGYETLIGQRGVNVSGGQKQRIAIARALIKKPRILILDDSTSAVDMGTEAKIQQAMKKLMQNTTSIVIAQRISTVLEADKILVLEDGKIVGEGPHQELLANNPVYQEIYTSQLGKEALANG